MEHWEAIRPGGYRFVWDDDLFRPGTDTFLLSSLPRLKAGMRVLELGCGTGLLSMLLLQRQPQLLVTGIDIQPDAIRLAQKAAMENRLQDRLSFRTDDLRTAAFGSVHFDLVVCNPPYFPAGSGYQIVFVHCRFHFDVDKFAAANVQVIQFCHSSAGF